MTKKTSLYQAHADANAKIVDFHGWLLPIHYGSQIEEHLAVRETAGMFDVSHMNIVDFKGDDAERFLSYLLANDVAKLKEPGVALYSLMLNKKAGILDDLIVYKRKHGFRVVLNSATFDSDMAWIEKNAQKFNLDYTVKKHLSMLAIQGPKAREITVQCFPGDVEEKAMALKPFHFFEHEEYFIARTGYTGEDGFEIIADSDVVGGLWEQLLNHRVVPCGLGARDTLRLEAGLNLYGNDMNETESPHTSNVLWTIAYEPKERDFIGRAALEKLQQAPPEQKLLGLVLNQRGVLRDKLDVYKGDEMIGQTTSGSFSPTLHKGIAMARINAKVSDEVEVAIRNKRYKATVVKLPFVRRGKILVNVKEEDTDE